jgi:hypothetical protein
LKVVAARTQVKLNLNFRDLVGGVRGVGAWTMYGRCSCSWLALAALMLELQLI